MLADMAVEVEAMRLLTYKAAWLIDQGATAPAVQIYEGTSQIQRVVTEPPEGVIRISELTIPPSRG